jgi:hypothetical protein
MWNEMLALQAPLFETILRAARLRRSRYPSELDHAIRSPTW